jgi:hypothetical protein
MLVVTPPPSQTESLMGYVLRLTQVNGYPTVNYILGELRKDADQTTIGRLDASPLMPLAAISPQQMNHLTMRVVHKDSRATTALCGKPLPIDHVQQNSPKVCSRCLTETGQCEAFWELSVASACPIHLVALRNQCDICKRRLTWRRKSVWQCMCGADLRAQPCDSDVNPYTVELMACLRTALYGGAIQSEMFSVLSGLSISDALDVVGVLCRKAVPNNVHIRRPRALVEYLSYRDTVAEMLAHWPDNFRRYLIVRYRHLESVAITPLFGNEFGWVRSVTDKCKKTFSQAFHKEVLLFAARYWPRAAIARSGKKLPVDRSHFTWGRAWDLQAISGLHNKTIRKCIEDGGVPMRAVMTSRGQAKIFYALVWARDYKSRRSTLSNGTLAARKLDISVNTFVALRQRNVYQARHYGYAMRHVLTDADVLSLKHRILGCARTHAFGKMEKAVRLADVFKTYWKASAERKADLIEAILLGNMDVRMGSAERVGELLLTEQAVHSFFGMSKTFKSNDLHGQ